MLYLIDNYDSFTYNLVQYFDVLGAELCVVRNDAISIAELDAAAPQALIISPGPSNPDHAGISMRAIAHFAGRIPILGVCLGHQSIAQSFGGKIIHARRLMHGKVSRIQHDGKGLFQNIPQNFKAMRYHSLAVDEALPACLEVSARSEDGEIMGLRHRSYPIESIQYHPESIGSDYGLEQLKNFLLLV